MYVLPVVGDGAAGGGVADRTGDPGGGGEARGEVEHVLGGGALEERPWFGGPFDAREVVLVADPSAVGPQENGDVRVLGIARRIAEDLGVPEQTGGVRLVEERLQLEVGDLALVPVVTVERDRPEVAVDGQQWPLPSTVRR